MIENQILAQLGDRRIVMPKANWDSMTDEEKKKVVETAEYCIALEVVESKEGTN